MSGRRRHLAGVRNAAGTGPEVLSVSLHQKKMLWLASPFLLLTILLLIHFTYHRSISWFCDARSASDSDSRPYKYFPQGHRHSQSRRRNRTRQTRSPLRQPSRFVRSPRQGQTRQDKSSQDKTNAPESLAHTEGPLFGALFESSHQLTGLTLLTAKVKGLPALPALPVLPASALLACASRLCA